MVKFSGWGEIFIFIFILSCIVLIPCILVVMLGTKMINQLGRYPTKTPIIQMSIFFPLVLIEFFAFGAFVLFYNAFGS